MTTTQPDSARPVEPRRPLHKTLAWVAGISLMLGGCMSAAHLAQNLDNRARVSETKQGIALLRAHISRLQAAGDPLGDYYYALGNSDGWISDVSDPKAITQLFEKAAAKGSMDAKILLALQLATGEDRPGQLDDGMVPSRDLAEWEQGLTQLLPLLRQQCSVRRLVMDDGRARTSYYSVAYKIWPTFRDGHHESNSQGKWELKVSKDPERQQVWEDIHRQCPIPQFEWVQP